MELEKVLVKHAATGKSTVREHVEVDFLFVTIMRLIHAVVIISALRPGYSVILPK
jgi:hypothetical protein